MRSCTAHARDAVSTASATAPVRGRGCRDHDLVFAASSPDEPLSQSIGFALAAAVFFDAVIVRMTLIPPV